MFLPQLILEILSKSFKHYVILHVFCMSFVFHSHVFVSHRYITHMQWYVIHMSHVCNRMSSVYHLYVLVCHLYVTHVYSNVIRMSLVCTCMSFVCTPKPSLWFYHETTCLWFYHELYFCYKKYNLPIFFLNGPSNYNYTRNKFCHMIKIKNIKVTKPSDGTCLTR